MKGHCRWLSCGLLFLALAAPAGAENPHVSLKVENATAAQAVAALARAADLPLRLRAEPNQGAPAAGAGLERASFDWSDTSFGAALRQLCERFGLRPRFRGGAYELLPGGGGAGRLAGLQKPVGLVERNGVRLFPTQLAIQDNRGRRLDLQGGGPNFDGHSNLSLSFSCRLQTIDPDAILGFDNVVARDDLGTILEANQLFALPPNAFFLMGDSEFPDEWSGMVSLPGPPPGAKRLAWVEGELLAYRQYRRHRIEVPLPLAAGGARQACEGTVVETTRFDPGAPAADGNPGPPAVLEGRITVPPGGKAEPDPRRRGAVLLVGASGEVYAPNGFGGGGGGGPEGSEYRLHCRYDPAPPEPVVKAVYSLVERDQPEPILRFRIENLPLPPEPPIPPRPVRPPPRLPNSAPVDRPYYQEGGAVLLCRVEIGGRPAGEGSLRIGLAPKTVDGWGPLRWLDAEVGADGSARLSNLRPGHYRLLRQFQPKVAPAAGAGRWVNEEVEIDLAAGKEAKPPPLRWTGAAARPRQ